MRRFFKDRGQQSTGLSVMTEDKENTEKNLQILIETLGSMFPYLLTLYLLLTLAETIWKNLSDIFIMNNLFIAVTITGIFYLAGYKEERAEDKKGEGNRANFSWFFILRIFNLLQQPDQIEQNIN